MGWISMVTVSQEQVRQPITANGVYLSNFTPPELVAHELCLLNQMFAAYLLLTELERRGILEHGGSIRNCWYHQKDGVHPRELILALTLECNHRKCPYCNCPLDVQFSPQGIAQYWCQVCCQEIKESGKK